MEPGFGQYQEKNGDWIYYYCDGFLNFSLTLLGAQEVLKNVFEEFDLSPVYLKIAVARLLTPHCQGLMGWRKRSPLWVITANQPRSGKDCMAMIAPIVHSQYATQDPPLEEDDEVKRRITTALMSGRRFMHFANCRKELDNPSLEAAVTAEFWSDRIIGTSAEQTVPNEINFSLSFNGHLPMTRDLAARMCVIHIFNKRPALTTHTFKQDLHTLLSTFNPPKGSATASTDVCRRNVLAALDALIENWAFLGAKDGGPFTSYPEWARIVGGVVKDAGYGNPCDPDPYLTELTPTNDWDKALIVLAKEVSAKGPGYYTSSELYQKFIEPNVAAYEAFGDYIVSSDSRDPIRAFNSALSKFLKQKVRDPINDGADIYSVELKPYSSLSRFKFSLVFKGPSTAAAPATTPNQAETQNNAPESVKPNESSQPSTPTPTASVTELNAGITADQAKPTTATPAAVVTESAPSAAKVETEPQPQASENPTLAPPSSTISSNATISDEQK
jgi:hypothetical protein